MQFRAKQIAPPKNWETFEDLCHALFKRVWNDPLAQKNGRLGQPQQGVDIFGSIGGERSTYRGVQCKGKDRNYGSKATIAEIVSEVGKADTFTPPLEHWVFATTASVDGKLQKLARELSAGRASKELFAVDVLGWEEIQALMAEHPDVIAEFYPEHSDHIAAVVEAARSLSSTTRVARPKPSNLPGSIQNLFKGREQFLDELHESFKRNAATAITGKAVHGLGGVGKTRTAIEYAHAYSDDYGATFFLSGKSENDLKDALAALAGGTVLDLPEKDLPDLDARAAAAIRWLQANPRWLVIVDNVDDELAARAVRAFLDQVSQSDGHLLITSRMGDWGHGVEPLELDLLSLEAAKDLLRSSTPHRTTDANEDWALTRLADKQLGCLTLALVQAAAYIEERRLGFADYGALFDTEATKLLVKLGEAAIRNLGYPLPVALTWQASFDRLSDTGKLLLDMLVWLSIEPIPRDLFDVWPQAESVDLDEGLAELTRYSFVQWEAENSAITLHRLVAQVTRERQEEAARDRALGALFPWIYARKPGMNASDVRCWPQLLPLLPHMLQLFERTTNHGPYSHQASVYNEFATLLQALARYAEAEPLFRSALELDKESYGRDHPKIAIRLNNLAELLRETNRMTEAEPLYRRALALDEANDPKGIQVAADLNNLAQLFRATHRSGEAEPLFHRALAIYEANYGDDHSDAAIVLNNMALLLHDQGRLDEAEPLQRRALAIDEANYGPGHPAVATDLNNLAGLLQATNRLTEAEHLYRRALEIDEASYGPDHPDVAVDLNNLAWLLRDTHGLAEAEPLYRRNMSILLRASKASGHLLANAVPAIQNYAFALIEAGLGKDQIATRLNSIMMEAGFDPAELWPSVFGSNG